MTETHYTIEDLRAFARYDGDDATTRMAADIARSALTYIDAYREDAEAHREGAEYWKEVAWKYEVELSR